MSFALAVAAVLAQEAAAPVQEAPAPMEEPPAPVSEAPLQDEPLAAVVTVPLDPVTLQRYLDLAWRREPRGDGWTVRDGLGNVATLEHLGAEGTNPLLPKLLSIEEAKERKKGRKERWLGIAALAVSPLPLVAVVEMDGYGVRDDSFTAAGRYNDALIVLAASSAALGATVVIDSLAWKPRLQRRRADPHNYLQPSDADAIIDAHNKRLRAQLDIPEDTP